MRLAGVLGWVRTRASARHDGGRSSALLVDMERWVRQQRDILNAQSREMDIINGTRA